MSSSLQTFVSPIEQVQLIADKYYSVDKYEHVVRVAKYTTDSTSYWDDKDDATFAICLAWAHDLYEDTECGYLDIFSSDFDQAIRRLTWDKKEESYDGYCARIRSQRDESQLGRIVWWVKLMDMKDHLMQTETLTNKLKEKYLSGMRFLL